MRMALPDLAAAILILVFTIVCAMFAWQPSLATFADDSVSYLVVAQVYSPWQAASAAIAEAFAREAAYPPLFPAVLALTGAAHSMAAAHAVTAVLLAACLPLVYALGVSWLGSRWGAFLAVAATALLPLLWVSAKGILSEPLYCLMLLGTLRVLEWETDRRAKTVLLALLMTGMVLTRTAGIALLAAYGLWVMTRRELSLAARGRLLLPFSVAAIGFGVWLLLRPEKTYDPNAPVLYDLAQSLLRGEFPWAAYGASILRQANAYLEAWTGLFLLYWFEGQPPRVLLTEAVGLLALAGWALRLRAARPDAWLMAGYLVTYLLWPFYDQMARFILPAVPVLVLYAFFASAVALRALGRAPALGYTMLALLVLSLTVPPLAFIAQRASAATRHAEIVDWYRRADIDDARERANVQLDLLADMESIRTLTRPQDRVMWVTPSYIALLADRRGVQAPSERLPPERFRAAVGELAPDYVFLSAYHPRDTVRDTAWRTGLAALAEHGEVVHARRNSRGVVSSVLLKPGPAPVRRSSP